MNDDVLISSGDARQAITTWEWIAMGVASAALIALCATRAASISWIETFGFVTGGICVWLGVREHLLNWPIGLINNVVFFVFFFNDRLFADAFLQWIYFGLGAWGWWNWIHFQPGTAALPITRVTRSEWIVLLAFLPLGTMVLRMVLSAVSGASPFWDALTTLLSLSAQYLLCRKRVENWLVWIVADAIYVPLYVSRAMHLTAALYALFLLMCIYGFFAWRSQLAKDLLADAPQAAGSSR